MSGLNWTSYNSNSLGNNNTNYTQIVNFFNINTPSVVSNGTLTTLQIFDTGYQNPDYTIFTGSVNYTAIKFYGYFVPPTSGSWTFNIGSLLPNNGYNTDDVGTFFLGPANSTIIPSQTYSSLATSPSSTIPIIYNNYTTPTNTRFSAAISLIAGNSYPILFYYNQSVGGYALGLSFSSPSYNNGAIISDFTGIINTSNNYPCFKTGTKILTNKGYIPIEDLRKGDLIKTLRHDFKEIYIIGKRDIYHPAQKERIKDQLYKCSNEQYSEIFEDLIITGTHSILVDNFINEEQKQKIIEVNGKIYITDQKYRLPACTDPRATVYSIPGTYTIYHLALENDDYYMNYGIYANGLLVETCSKRYLKELSTMTLIE